MKAPGLWMEESSPGMDQRVMTPLLPDRCGGRMPSLLHSRGKDEDDAYTEGEETISNQQVTHPLPFNACVCECVCVNIEI